MLALSKRFGAFFQFLLTFFEAMSRVLPLGFQVGFLRGHRLLPAIERVLFRLQPISQLRRSLAKVLERVFYCRSHLSELSQRGTTNHLQRRTLDDGMRRTTLKGMGLIDSQFVGGKSRLTSLK